MKVTGKLNGAIAAQSSKSAAHRAIICAALAQGTSKIRGVTFSDDIRATLSCAQALGMCEYTIDADCISITGGGQIRFAQLNCQESGSTLRFFIPLALLGQGAEFRGQGRLMHRPLDPLKDALKDTQWQLTQDTLTVKGTLTPGEYSIRGDVSSQYITGLMLALPLLGGDSKINITTPIESRGYIDLTSHIQSLFGVHTTFNICGNQRYTPFDYTVEGDYSHAAFFAAAGAIGKSVRIDGLNPYSYQGDKEIFDLLAQMGAKVCVTNTDNTYSIEVSNAPLHGIEINASQIPDLVPILAVAACAARGTTRITGASRLKLKESDRLESTMVSLNALGANIEKTPDGLIIHGTKLRGGTASSFGDHRIAMSLAIASAICSKPVEILGHECASKSAPHFYEEFTSLGGYIYE